MGLISVSWPDAQIAGVLRNLEADYWALAPVPGNAPFVAVAGHRPTDPDGQGRLYVLDARTMTVTDSSPPFTVDPTHRTPWVEIAWTDDPDQAYVLTYDARVSHYRRSTGMFVQVAANAIWSRIRFDRRRNAVLVLTPGDPFDWPGRPTLQWFVDSGEVLPRVSLAGLSVGGANPVVRDARRDENGVLLVLTGTEQVGPLYGTQTCRVFSVIDTAASGASISLLTETEAYGCRNLVLVPAALALRR